MLLTQGVLLKVPHVILTGFPNHNPPHIPLDDPRSPKHPIVRKPPIVCSKLLGSFKKQALV